MLKNFLILALSIVIMLSSCNDDSSPKYYNFGEFHLFERPDNLADDYPSLFTYKNSRIIQAGHFGELSYNRQGVVVMQTQDDRATVFKYYNKVFSIRKWQIIQSTFLKNSAVIMAESPSRKLITIIIRNENPATIKLYFKQTGIL